MSVGVSGDDGSSATGYASYSDPAPAADPTGGDSGSGITSSDGGSGSGSGTGSSSDSGSGGGDGSSTGSGSGSASDSGGGFSIPDALTQDMAQISQYGVPSLASSFFRWGGLLLNGGTPWDGLRPYSFTSENPTTYTATYTANGDTSTTTAHRSATATSSGNGGSSESGSGGGSYDISYQLHTDSTSTTTGPDASGRATVWTSQSQYDLTWHAWGDSAGVTNYKVTEGLSDTNAKDVPGTSGSNFTSHVGNSDGSNLMAEGEVDANGAVTGDFTFSGHVDAASSLNDDSGAGGAAPDPTVPGSMINFGTSTALKLDESGSLKPDSTNKGTVEAQSSENGEVGAWDGTGNLAGATRDDGDDVTSTYDASQGPTTSGPGTTGTVSTNGPQTKLNVPTGKNVVYVIDIADAGWRDWPEPFRSAFAQDLKLGLTKDNIATGETIRAGLAPPKGNYISGNYVEQVAQDLDAAIVHTGPIDVLVIGDHGATGRQSHGNQFIDPVWTPALLNQVAGRVRRGGTLVLTGCSVFGGQAAVDNWQAYATGQGITIMGSASTTTPNPNNYTGVWITLVPGGKAPTLVKTTP